MDVKRTRDHGYGYSERSYVPGHAWTLLHSLSTKEYKHKEIVELLVDRGADVNARSMFGGDTPLHIAANLGHKEVVGILIAKGADINAQNSAGKTPLHKGLMCQTYNDDCKENVKLLIAKGADVSIRNKEGVTPLSYAIKYWPEMVELLKKNGAK